MDSVRDHLKGKRVALYFTAGWCPACRSFEPSLLQFRAMCQEAGKPIELIMVSSDRSAGDANSRAKLLDCLSVPFEGEDRAELKRRFGVWAGMESREFGISGRRSGVPALVVLASDGTELAFVDAERGGGAALTKWKLDEGDEGVWE
jgi:nucleoredoxin